MDNKKYTFTNIWFEKNIQEWSKALFPLVHKPLQVLEIGVYEGAATTWLLDNILHNPKSKITCVDNFEGGVEHQSINVFKNHLPYIEERFKTNVKKSGKATQVELIKSFSFSALINLCLNQKKFDLIYIDASHLACDVLSDSVLAWNLLKIGGILIFDDYKWNKYQEDYNNPKIAIDAFLDCYKPEIKILHISYQVIIEKINRKNVFTLIEQE